MSRGKKEKEPKRKKKGLWKMTPLWESKRRGFPQRFGKACWLFHISAQGPVADEPLTINQRRGSLLLDQGGSVLRCQNEKWRLCQQNLRTKTRKQSASTY